MGQGLVKEVGWFVDEFKDHFKDWKMFLVFFKLLKKQVNK
jgi:hypothetical protein